MSLEAALPVIGVLDRTLPVTSDPLYQSAHLSLTLHDIIKAMSDEGMVIRQVEETDFTTFHNDTVGGLDNYIERFEDLLQTGTSEVIAALPDVLPIITALVSGGSAPVLAILAKGVLDTMLRHWDTRADVADGEPQGADMTEVVAKLEEMKLNLAYINAALNTDSVVGIAQTVETRLTSLESKLQNSTSQSIAQILEDALITTNVAEERYALMWNLINQAIRIIVENNNEYSDVTLEDSS